ncbi:RDD family protein [Nonomuraea sp. NPDC050536]|uniref:RDD family protein n=1 Tax=Nonomuraea sp. NPDC050536 TaxID=3364366 RepID=UPI0037C5467A
MGSPPPSKQLAGRWRRLFAGILDAIIVSIVSAPFGTGWKVVWDSTRGVWDRIPVQHVLITSIIGFLYFWLLEAFWNGQTLGKKLFGMRVVQESGARAGVGQIALREFVRVLLGWICCIGELLNYGWILFDPRKQALHDKAAKTLVVDA